MLISEKPLNNILNQKTYDLFVPSLIPNEYLVGYFGRIAILNHFENITKLHMFLARKTHKNIARETPILMCLSRLLEIDPIYLWENHTAYEIKLKNKNTRNTRKLLRSSHYSTRNKTIGHKNMPAFFCKNCVEDDLEKNGYSFWRRDHQTIESDYCQIHHEEKLLAATENIRLYYSPAWHLSNGKYCLM